MPSFTSLGLTFAPHLPWTLLAVLGIAALALLAFSLLKRAPGGWARALALAIVMTALANPLLVEETREGLTDIVALVVDRSQSQDIGNRREETERALADMREKLRALPGVEVREAETRTDAAGSDGGGTALFAAVNSALAEAPPDRVAGAIVITDGQVHDAPANPRDFRLGAPLHVLLTGAQGERDRKLTIVQASRFGIVGEQGTITLRVDDFGEGGGAPPELTLRIDGEVKSTRPIQLGEDTVIEVPVAHGGENIVELEVNGSNDEQTLQNNRAAAVINGVRDRLRVLLVSGEPHAGERVWRNLLKADPSVDLVHFTILRPPYKQDVTPIDELSLIAFPTRELFDTKLADFDLIIFDRYQNRDILPQAYFANIARYVENGGALLIASGPEFADVYSSIYRTPLAAILPAQPTGEVITGAFRPRVTEAGFAHPVTRDLPQSNQYNEDPAAEAAWGRWFRYLAAQRLSGTVVMEAPDGAPLMVLDRVGEGRIAQVLSDQIWLWARGYEGGGPQAEILRRLAHWEMKEPDLEEERLTAAVVDGDLRITRRTMAATAAPVTVTTPSGQEQSVTLSQTGPGSFAGTVRVGELGLYRLNDGTLNAVAAAGPLNPREVADMRATDAVLKPFADATGGGVAWIKDGLPDLRTVREGQQSAGRGWFGLTQRGAYRVTAVESQALLPPWLALILVLGTVLFAWRRESR